VERADLKTDDRGQSNRFSCTCLRAFVHFLTASSREYVFSIVCVCVCVFKGGKEVESVVDGWQSTIIEGCSLYLKLALKAALSLFDSR
jgi:hypothetical protein